MRTLRRELLGPFFFIALSSLAIAGDKEDGHDDANARRPAASAPLLTGKERLGPKWTDEQRIDNCHVPVDKRGTRPRPSACRGAPPS